VLIATSRETGRFIIPKGWAEKGKKGHQVAAKEAKQEAGVLGSISKKPIGAYIYWKRLPDHFELCEVRVFVLKAERQLSVWREKGQRRYGWFLVDDAVDLLDDPAMATLLRQLPKRVRAKPLKTPKDTPAAAAW
jgi:8-oxo-dGTP pyrophosphatase MutT (NUDIX family)